MCTVDDQRERVYVCVYVCVYISTYVFVYISHINDTCVYVFIPASNSEILFLKYGF